MLPSVLLLSGASTKMHDNKTIDASNSNRMGKPYLGCTDFKIYGYKAYILRFWHTLDLYETFSVCPLELEGPSDQHWWHNTCLSPDCAHLSKQDIKKKL